MRDERTNDNEQLKIELLSQWKMEAESRNYLANLFFLPMGIARCFWQWPGHKSLVLLFEGVFYIIIFIKGHNSLGSLFEGVFVILSFLVSSCLLVFRSRVTSPSYKNP